jgi:ring-1,2-phenylacetyl-CoA epoxidase subunit PaaC
VTTGTEKEQDASVRASIRDLILVLADTKRLLGYRYAEWMLGAPELETWIACASMAQDEWGHARLLYSLLKEFGDDPEQLEHGRDPDAYHSMEVLDAPADTWPALVVLMAIVDTAVSVQIEALQGSSHVPLRQRVEKVLEEESFHVAHGVAWFRRLADGSDASRSALVAAAGAALGPVLTWFGPASDRAAGLRDAGVVDATGDELRARFSDRVAPLLELAGIDPDRAAEPSAAPFDEARRRSRPGGPDEETVRRIRGDHNRAFLMD